MFPDAMNSFHIMLGYTYTCSNIKLNAVKSVLLKLIKMTKNAEYVPPRAEELKLNFKTEADLRFACYKATHGINKSRDNILRVYACFFFCSSVYKTFFMENGCRVNNAFILDERQPCIKTFCYEKLLQCK